MGINYQSEYALHTLLYISRMASMGDFKTPALMGMSSDQVIKIVNMNSQQIHDMSALSQAKFVSVQFDHDALDVALEIIQDKTLRQQKIYELLTAGASYPVMKYLYGLSTLDVAMCKKFLNLPKGEGRPAMPNDKDLDLLWDHIKPSDLEDNANLANKLLRASEKTGLKINAIWLTLQEWNK